MTNVTIILVLLVLALLIKVFLLSLKISRIIKAKNEALNTYREYRSECLELQDNLLDIKRCNNNLLSETEKLKKRIYLLQTEDDSKPNFKRRISKKKEV